MSARAKRAGKGKTSPSKKTRAERATPERASAATTPGAQRAGKTKPAAAKRSKTTKTKPAAAKRSKTTKTKPAAAKRSKTTKAGTAKAGAARSSARKSTSGKRAGATATARGDAGKGRAQATSRPAGPSVDATTKGAPKATPTGSKKTATGPGRARSGHGPRRKRLNNFVIVIFDSCRFDSFMAAKPKTITKLGEVERRWSYASWTAPSHYNLLTGLMPHRSPQNVYASEYYKKDFFKYSERLGLEGTSFKALIPHLYFPLYLKSLAYRTHARVSLPVLNPRTTLNNGFDSFRLMKSHNDMRAIVEEMHFSDDHPSFWLLNVGETHYPYALPDEPPSQWPRISGVHGVFKHLDDHVVGGKVTEEDTKFFDDDKMRELRQRQIRAVEYLDGVVEQLFDILPDDTYVTITADHGELFGENGYFGHGPINHDKVFEVPFVEGKLR